MYKVLADFADMQDGGYLYRSGDVFPREGVEASQVRLAELSSHTNRLGHPLIAEAIKPMDDVAEVRRPSNNTRKRKAKTE